MQAFLARVKASIESGSSVTGLEPLPPPPDADQGNRDADRDDQVMEEQQEGNDRQGSEHEQGNLVQRKEEVSEQAAEEQDDVDMDDREDEEDAEEHAAEDAEEDVEEDAEVDAEVDAEEDVEEDAEEDVEEDAEEDAEVDAEDQEDDPDGSDPDIGPVGRRIQVRRSARDARAQGPKITNLDSSSHSGSTSSDLEPISNPRKVASPAKKVAPLSFKTLGIKRTRRVVDEDEDDDEDEVVVTTRPTKPGPRPSKSSTTTQIASPRTTASPAATRKEPATHHRSANAAPAVPTAPTAEAGPSSGGGPPPHKRRALNLPPIPPLPRPTASIQRDAQAQGTAKAQGSVKGADALRYGGRGVTPHLGAGAAHKSGSTRGRGSRRDGK